MQLQFVTDSLQTAAAAYSAARDSALRLPSIYAAFSHLAAT